MRYIKEYYDLKEIKRVTKILDKRLSPVLSLDLLEDLDYLISTVNDLYQDLKETQNLLAKARKDSLRKPPRKPQDNVSQEG